jgi:hypothetical protein
MLVSLLSSLPPFCIYALAVILIALALVQLGHRVLDLLRDYRDFRDGY